MGMTTNRDGEFIFRSGRAIYVIEQDLVPTDAISYYPCSLIGHEVAFILRTPDGLATFLGRSPECLKQKIKRAWAAPILHAARAQYMKGDRSVRLRGLIAGLVEILDAT